MKHLRVYCETSPASVEDSTTERDGRWAVYSGVEMCPCVEGLNNGNGVRLVVDLDTLTSPPSLTALREHCEWDIIGRWDQIVIAAATGVLMDLHLTRPANDQEAGVLGNVVQLAAHIRNKVPFKASIGVEAGPGGQWELIPQGATVVVNGRTFSGDGDLPLYVLRGGVLFETSLINLFPADRDTGRVAARRGQSPDTKTPQEQPMKCNLKALLKKWEAAPATVHARIAALAADDKTDDEIDKTVTSEAMAALTAENERLTAENARLTEAAAAAEQEEVGGGNGSNDKTKDKDGPSGTAGAKPGTPAAKAGAAASTGVAFAGAGGKGKQAVEEQPKSFMQAMLKVGAETNLTGDNLHRATCAKYPDLDPNKNSPVRAMLRAAAEKAVY